MVKHRDHQQRARFDELLRVVRVKLTAEQCRTLASIAAAARDDRGLDDLVAGEGSPLSTRAAGSAHCGRR